MKTRVSKDLCIGCGLCADMSPELYIIEEDGKAKAISEEIPEDAADSAKDAAASCPTSAIEVEE